MAEEILSLSTIAERARINITSKKHPTGKLYDLANLADLGPYEYATVVRRNEEMTPLLESTKKPTPAQERQLARALDESVSLVCPSLDAALIRELTTQQKQMIVVAWSVEMRKGAAEGNRRSRRTGAASSRASSSTSAATRKRGSTPRAGS